jgi:hypothetical protein
MSTLPPPAGEGGGGLCWAELAETVQLGGQVGQHSTGESPETVQLGGPIWPTQYGCRRMTINTVYKLTLLCSPASWTVGLYGLTLLGSVEQFQLQYAQNYIL